MPKKKTTESPDKVTSPPAVEAKGEKPDKVAGPQPQTPALSAATAGGRPVAARAADLLTSPKEGLGTAERSRMTGSMQQSVGNARVGRMLGTGVQRKTDDAASSEKIQRSNGAVSNLGKLDELLDEWWSGSEIIILLGKMTAAERTAVLTRGYQSRMAATLTIGQMVQAVNILGPELEVKLRWVDAASPSRAKISYYHIKSMITLVPQAERDALRTNSWQAFFVGVCTDDTMLEAVRDLGFDLTTQLYWLLAKKVDVETMASLIRLTPAAALPAAAADRSLMEGLIGELGVFGALTIQQMLTAGLLSSGPLERETDTGNAYQSWLTHTRREITISKNVEFIEKDTFGPGGYDALKQRLIAAVTNYLSRKYKVKIASPGKPPQVADGEYPIVVVIRDDSSADFPMRLRGGEHGRSAVGEAGGDIYELGLDWEVFVPDAALAHESAHMILGASDEYEDTDKPPRTQYHDHSLMDDFGTEGIAQAEIKARHFGFLVDYIGKYFPDRSVSIVK